MSDPTPPATYDDLSAIYINCTLKPSPELSHTELLGEASMDLMRQQGVAVTFIRAVDHDIAPGVQPDMTEHGFPRDDWPAIQEQVMAANILVLMTPLWLGDKSSVATRVIGRLYGYSGVLDDAVSTPTTGEPADAWSPATRTASSTRPWGSCTPYSTSATWSRPRPTPAGSARRARARPTATRSRTAPVSVWTTTSRSATPRS